MKSRVRRFDMSAMRKSLLLLLATFALASCGGGGSGSNSVFSPPGTDTELTLTATTTTLPASPYTVGAEETAPFPGNFLGSPYISEVTVTWRHKNGDFVTGTSTVNVATQPTGTLTFSTLDSTTTTTTTGPDQFETLLGQGPVNVTAGTGTIYVHAGQTPGTGTLIVTAVDPVSNQNISAQLTITVVGASSGVPASITVSAASGVYISSSGGPQSTVVSATVTDGSGALVSGPEWRVQCAVPDYRPSRHRCNSRRRRRRRQLAFGQHSKRCLTQRYRRRYVPGRIATRRGAGASHHRPR